MPFTDLRIYGHLEAIVRMVSENEVTVVSAPTASGKTLGIPRAIVETGSRIMIAIDKVASVRASAILQQEVFSTDLRIGTGAEGIKQYDENNPIVYATAGHVERLMLNSIQDGQCKGIKFTDVLMVDEVHTGTLQNLVILSLWKLCADQGVKVPRLILTSATVDLEDFPDAAVYQYFEETKPIRQDYSPMDYKIGDKRLIPDMANVIIGYFNSSNIKGDIIAFLPGIGEIEDLSKLISHLPNSVIYSVTGKTSKEDLIDVMEPDPNGRKKIALATNVAEASITIRGLKVVIDSMLEKVSGTSSSGGARLETAYISKSSATQRRGRVGRIEPGICYRMCTEQFFDKLATQRAPEVERIPLHNTFLELANIGLDASKILKQKDMTRIDNTKDLLLKLKLLEIDEKNKFPKDDEACILNKASKISVTEAGKFTASLPLGVKTATFLWRWFQEGLPLFAGIALTVMIDSYDQGYTFNPQKHRDMSNSQYSRVLETHRKKFHARFVGYSDVHTFANIWRIFASETGGLRASPQKIDAWSIKNSMKAKKMKEVIKVIKQILGTFRRNYNKDIEQVRIDPINTVNDARPLFVEVYSDFLLKLDASSASKTRIVYRNCTTVFTLDGRTSLNRLNLHPPDYIAAILPREIQAAGRPTMNIISVAIDVPKTIIRVKDEKGKDMISGIPKDVERELDQIKEDNKDDRDKILEELQRKKFIQANSPFGAVDQLGPCPQGQIKLDVLDRLKLRLQRAARVFDIDDEDERKRR